MRFKKHDLGPEIPSTRSRPMPLMVPLTDARLVLLLYLCGRASAALSAVAGSSREKLVQGAWLDLRRNQAAHLREVEQSLELGYERIQSLPACATPNVRPFSCAASETGMGPACPFLPAESCGADEPADLVFETEEPIFSADECRTIVKTTREHIASGGGGSGFTLADTNRNIAVADMPSVQGWLNSEGLPRVAALAGGCFGEGAIGRPEDLLIYRALVVQYDAAAGLTHQEVHRDGSLVTCVVTLNPQDEYTGGGTYLEALDAALAPPMGHAVLQASALRHAGHFIDSGERWVMVLFLIAEEMRYGEHVRHLKA